MELLKARHGDRHRGSCRRVELLLIGLLLVRISLAQPVIFHAGFAASDFDGSKPLYVPGNPSANIVELQEDNVTCLGQFHYIHGDEGTLGISLNGTAVGEQQSDLSGRCVYNSPIRIKTVNGVSSFGTMFKVSIIGEGVGYCGPAGATRTLQGLAFIIGTDIFTQGAAKGYLGWLNSTTNAQQNSTGHNFAVEVDFFQDAEFEDPPFVHVGIDVNSLTSVSTAPFGSVNASSDKIQLTVWIEYDGPAKQIQVFTDASPNASSTKPLTPVISLGIDLSEILSADSMFVGFSGSISNVTFSGTTGNSTYPLGFQIMEWTFNSDGLAPDSPRNADGTEQLSDGAESKRRTERMTIIAATIPSLLLLLLLFLITYNLYRRNARLTAIAKKYQIEEDLLEQGPQNFKYKVLCAATKGFSSRELLGKGAFGCVYKGLLRVSGSKELKEVAVKRISATSNQGAREFEAEIKVIGQVQHRNLVRLLGWCHEKGELLLVYDYMPNGNVYQHLFEHLEGEPVLTWARRLKIMSGVATALAYLHEEWELKVIHRDVKASNVMLDREYNARLGHFGLARLSEHDQALQSTAVLAGTHGYLAPELVHTLKASEKTDVYSFGILVLEVATGRRPILSVEDEETSNVRLLVDWVWGLYKNDVLLEAADERLHSAWDPGEMNLFLTIGLSCCHPDPDERPTMREVLNIWKGSSPLPPLPRMKPVPIFISRSNSFMSQTRTAISTVCQNRSDVSSSDSIPPNDETAASFYRELNGVQSSATTYTVDSDWEGGTPSHTLRFRRCRSTTSLPM